LSFALESTLIAFDSNVHKIAIFSDELENVKQLNFSLHKFESVVLCFGEHLEKRACN
jgi:hypothetical protein